MLLVFVYEMILYIIRKPCMLWVRNLSVMALGALFSKTGIFCLKHCFANVCVVLCMCKSVLPRVL